MTGLHDVSQGIQSFKAWAADPGWLPWAAGIFEGEGSVSPKTNRYKTPSMTITMTDEDVLRRFWVVVGCGTFTGPHFYQGHPEWKPYWRWGVGGRGPVGRLATEFDPYLGKRRRGRFREVLQQFDELREIRLAAKADKS